MTIVPEITSVDGWARHSQIIRLPAPPSLLVDNNCRRAGTKQMGARGEAQGIRWYGGLHGQNSARGKFRTSPRKMRGKFRTKLKYGIPPPPPVPWGKGHSCLRGNHGLPVRSNDTTDQRGRCLSIRSMGVKGWKICKMMCTENSAWRIKACKKKTGGGRGGGPLPKTEYFSDLREPGGAPKVP